MKTGRKQAIPIAPALRQHLEKQPSAKGPLMPTLYAGYQRNGSSTLSNTFYRLMVKAGVTEKRSHRKKAQGRSGKRQASQLSFHSFRHTLTSLLKSAGVSGQITQEIVGHDSAAVSKGYTHIDAAAIQEAIGRIPDLGDLG